MFAVFRADASPILGGGHVMRCLTLADALADNGWQCGFACNGEAADVIPGVSRHDLLPLAPNADAVGLMKERWGKTWDLAVVDHYGLDAAFERALRPVASRILVIDDLHDRTHDCDFLLDQTLGRAADDYEGLVPVGCALFLGPDYALLRPEFAMARAETLKRRKKPGDISRLLVTFGATDPHDLTSMTLEALESLDLEMKVDVVLGGGAPHLGKVRRFAEGAAKPVTVHQDADDIAGLMSAADLAVGALGGMSWERCCLGLPSILVTFADNQREISSALRRYNAAVTLGWFEEVTQRDLSSALESLCLDAERRSKIIAMAAAVCDGQGVKRIKEALGYGDTP